jgi:DNA-binding MarR family transcriptional regulator
MALPVDDAVFEQLHALMHSLKSHLHHAVRSADDDALAPMEARALGFFARAPGSTARDLVQHSRRDKAQITRLIKQLEARGLLAGAPDPEDRRCHRLQLTDLGHAMQRTMQQHRKRWAATLVKDFSAADRAQLLTLLARMRHNIEGPPAPGTTARQPSR